MRKRISVVTLLIVGSFTGALAISEYRQSAATTINFTITEYNDDGTISDSSKVVRVCNTRGEWSQMQIFANGQLAAASGRFTPRHESLTSFPDSPRRQILDRTVVVLFDRRSEAWYDPSLHQFLKSILYTDETRQTVRVVEEAVEIKD